MYAASWTKRLSLTAVALVPILTAGCCLCSHVRNRATTCGCTAEPQCGAQHAEQSQPQSGTTNPNGYDDPPGGKSTPKRETAPMPPMPKPRTEPKLPPLPGKKRTAGDNPFNRTQRPIVYQSQPAGSVRLPQASPQDVDPGAFAAGLSSAAGPRGENLSPFRRETQPTAPPPRMVASSRANELHGFTPSPNVLQPEAWPYPTTDPETQRNSGHPSGD